MIRVLVVDDDFMVARLHSTLVEQVPGFTVAGAVHSGTEALAAVRELRPDLVLLDMYLPDVPGLEVLRELRGTAAPEEGPDVLVVTAARDAETVRGAQRGGAVQYIIKPFEGQLLKERLSRYAERRAALAALQKPEQGDVDRLFADTADPAGAPGDAAPAGTAGTAGTADSAGHAAQFGPGGADASRTAAPGAPHPHPAGPGPAGPARLPKGLTEQTAALVRATLEAETDPGGLSASECAGRSGLSRVSARRYLEHFVSLGTARVTLRYGTTGRPERRYHRVDLPRPEAEAEKRPDDRGEHVIHTTENP
ncbi:response regulator transcription factor [Streptomyces winkii]|uniref:response regulator transcription factor n=1 Tax=Streptomyces winkii TaxID=3051178 RepID=UPI0028D652D8|nr:response regulator [Streptomyces sp. DSM 40971]